MRFLSKFSFGLFLGLITFGFIFGSLIIFPGLPVEIHLSSAWIMALACLVLVFSSLERNEGKWAGSVPVTLMLIYLVSDIPLRAHGFTQRPFPFLLFAVLMLAGLFTAQKRCNVILCVLAAACSLTAVAGFMYFSEGALITADDHPAFLYRLIQLKENFPLIPFYNPLWNTGVEAREFFASGVLNFFLLFSPFIYVFDPARIYNYLIAAALFLLTPLFSYLAARLLDMNRRSALVAWILSLSSSLFWYRWALAYGTMGFILSASLVPLNLALFSKIAARQEPISAARAALTAVSFTLMFIWSPVTLLFLPLLAFVFFRFGSYLRDKGAWLTLCLMLVLNLPWMFTFYNVSSVGDFVSTSAQVQPPEEEAPSHSIAKFKIPDNKSAQLSLPALMLKQLRTNFLPLNPLVLIFGISGLMLLAKGTSKAVLMTVSGAAVFLGILGPAFKPQLELERMIVILGLVLALPAASLISEVISASTGRLRVFSAALLAILALSPLWLWRITSNRTSERYSVAGPEVPALVSAVKQHAAEGRVLFAGFTLHVLGGGHVAPLAAWTQVPLVAVSYQHDHWRYTDVIPVEYRSRKTEGVVTYLDLLNISAVVTHERFWRKWFSKHPELFERVWEGGGFQLFRRKSALPGYFLEGSGKIISQTGNSVVLSLSSDEAVIKFNYLPFLESSDCSLQPEKISQSITMIRLAKCRNSNQIEIKAAPIWRRLL